MRLIEQAPFFHFIFDVGIITAPGCTRREARRPPAVFLCADQISSVDILIGQMVKVSKKYFLSINMNEQQKTESDYVPGTTIVLVAFGANQGDCRTAYEKTVQQLTNHEAIHQVIASEPIETDPVCGDIDSEPSQDSGNKKYLNACLRLMTTLSAQELHAVLVEIETGLGRERKERWGPRTIDLDLLLFGDQQIQEKGLIVPHPRMSFRKFVLEPSVEIASDMVHPVSGLTIAQLKQHLESKPDTVLVASNDNMFSRAVVEQVTTQGQTKDWTLSCVTEVMDFIRQAGQAKLVVSCFRPHEVEEVGEETTDVDGLGSASELARFARNFSGPTLELPTGIDERAATVEILAAIEAMQ